MRPTFHRGSGSHCEAAPGQKPSRQDHGFTLIEALAVVSIVGVLIAVAVPGFATFLSSHRAAVATNDFVHAIAVTRNEALRRGGRVYLAPTGTLWRDGWAIFIDRNDDRRFDAASTGGGDTLILRHGPLPASVSMTNPANAARQPFTDVGSPQRTYLMFDGGGFPRQRSGAFAAGSVLVADRTGGVQTLRTVCLAAYGRVRVVADRASCG